MSDTEEGLQGDQGEQEGEPKVFDEAYVADLRAENATRRLEAKEAKERSEKATQVALELAVNAYGRGLKDPSDLMVFYKVEDLLGEDGLPSSEKIEAAVADLIERKPHLDATRPDGDIDQGRKGTVPPAFDFAQRLRQAAG